MNIKETMREFVSNPQRLVEHAFNTDVEQLVDAEEFGAELEGFLSFKNIHYQQLYDTALGVKEFCLSQHRKFAYLENALKTLHRLESQVPEVFAGQRMHFAHQAYVFILGIYLYESSQKIREKINQEMHQTTKFRDFPENENFRYSGGTERGEFLFRWRLATLTHDLGYLFSLLKPNHPQFDDLIQAFANEDDGRLTADDFFTFNDKPIFSDLNNFVRNKTGISLARVKDYVYQNPSHEICHYEHGIMSSVTFLYIMNREFEKILGDRNSTEIGDTFYHRKFLTGCFHHIAMAVALHGLDPYCDKPFDESDDPVVPMERYLDYSNRPFSWLLKVCDMLQEWDKPTKTEFSENKELSETPIEVMVTQSGDINVRNFPENKGGEKDIIERMTNTPAEIRIELATEVSQ